MCWAAVVEAPLATMKLSNEVLLARHNARTVSYAMNTAEIIASGGTVIWVPEATGTPQRKFQGMGTPWLDHLRCPSKCTYVVQPSICAPDQ